MRISNEVKRAVFRVVSLTMTGLIAATVVMSAALLPRLGMVSAATQVVSIQRVSVPSTEGDAGSHLPAISSDGRYVAFESEATNLVVGDSNGTVDIFVRDRQTGEITRVSVDSSGGESNGESHYPSISADGRYVAFQSYATNLVSSDTNGEADIFVHDRQTGGTTIVSVDSSGNQGDGFCNAPSISADGRYVAFYSEATNLVDGDTNDKADIFVHDRQTGQTTRVSVRSDGAEGTGGGSYYASITADGRYVAFYSEATNLVDGDTNGKADIFVHDRQTSQTVLLSAAWDGGQSDQGCYYPSISADGRYVAFESYAGNLVAGDTNSMSDVFVRDRETGQTTRVSVASNGSEGDDNSYTPVISADGRYIVFYSDATNLVANDTNSRGDIFVHDRQTGQTTRVSVASDGSEGNQGPEHPCINADGRYVAFQSYASNMVAGDNNGADDIFVHDRQTGETTRMSLGCNAESVGDTLFPNWYPSISTDGRYVAFQSSATNLVAGDTNNNADIFVHDRQTGETTRVSVDSSGNQGNGDSFGPSLSADGRYVAFFSYATNLVPGDGNGVPDIFRHDRQTGETIRVSVAWNGNQGNQGSYSPPSISADGRYVAFQSSATNLVEQGDNNSAEDVFVRDLQTGNTVLVSVDSDGNQGNNHSYVRFASISADGRYVAFESAATNLVADDLNGKTDVFVRDLQLGVTSRVSVDSGGDEGNGGSYYPVISADGRYVAFESGATNLVAYDNNGATDIFVHDRVTGETTIASLSYAGSQGLGASVDCSISGDGRYVAFWSSSGNLVAGDTNGVADIFVRDLHPGGTTIRVNIAANGNQSNGSSRYPAISADGRHAAFYSYASNLVPDDSNGKCDVFAVSWENPALAYTPASIDFGIRYQRSTSTQTLQIHNAGTGTLSYSLTENSAWCSVSPGSGTSAGETDDVTVGIDTSGLSPGDYSCVIMIPSDGGLGVVPVYVSVQASPVIEVTPASHDFGTVALGASSDRIFTVSNSGTVDLVVGTVAGANALAAPFSIVSDNCSGQTIPPGGNRTVTVRFSPAAKGDFSDSFDIPSSDPLTPTVTVSLSGTAPNTPPTAPIVDVTPDGPATTADLVCSVTTGSADIDGDPVTYTYQWYKNGELQSTLTTNTVAAAQTAKGQVWKCVVTPNDGTANGPPGEDQVTVQNSAPTAPVVAITPDSPRKRDDLVCGITTHSTDADGDSVTYTYQWYKDGELQSTLTTNTVAAAQTAKGQVWKCVVTPNDGTADGPTVQDEVTVSGSGGGGFPAGGIAGIVIGVLVLAGVAAFFWLRRARKAPTAS